MAMIGNQIIARIFEVTGNCGHDLKPLIEIFANGGLACRKFREPLLQLCCFFSRPGGLTAVLPPTAHGDFEAVGCHFMDHSWAVRPPVALAGRAW